MILPITFLQRCAIFEGMKRGAVSDADTGSAIEIERVRNFDKFVGTQRDTLTRRAIGHVTDHPIAGFERCDTGTEALDRSGKLCSRRKWRFRLELVFAGDDQRVEKVQRRRMDFYDCLAGTRLRLRYIDKFEVIRLSVAGAEEGFHGGPSFVQRAFCRAPGNVPGPFIGGYRLHIADIRS